MVKQPYSGPLERAGECCWRIPKSYKTGMRVDGLIFADDLLIEAIRHDQAPEQVANVAFLPGIQVASLAMPDIHWGYGFCIGGVCATDPDEDGVISPGGVGYDINCGVRLVRSNLFYQDVKQRLTELIDALFRQVPAGVGKSGKYKFKHRELHHLMGEGVEFLKTRGLATDADISHTEAEGRLDGARGRGRRRPSFGLKRGPNGRGSRAPPAWACGFGGQRTSLRGPPRRSLPIRLRLRRDGRMSTSRWPRN